MMKFLARSISVTAILTLFSLTTAWGETIRLDEYEVKTAYIYNFAKYVDWPPDALPNNSSTLCICTIGKSPLNAVIESLTGKNIKGRRIAVRQLSQIESLDNCNLLFVNAGMKSHLPEIVVLATPRSILTVGDYKGFAAEGGIIEFVPVKDKIRFEINNRSAKKTNLKISSQLLSLAKTVFE